MSQQAAFVTGGTGKIGRYLVSRLISYGFRVKALTRKEENPWREISGVQVVKGDISDSRIISEAIRGCDYIFHMAVYQNINDENRDLFQHVNIEGTKTVLNCALNSGVKRIIYVSTAMVFEPTGNAQRDESWPKRVSCKSDLYLQTKIEALAIVNKMKKSLPITIVYPTAVIDLKDFYSSSPVSATGLQKFLWEKIGRGIPGGLANLIGPRERILNYVAVEDAAEGIIQAAMNGKAGEDYILGGENITAQEYLAAASQRAGKRPFPVRMPFFIFAAVSCLGRIIHLPPIVKMIGRNRPQGLCLSSEKARNNLGYDPRHKL